MGLAHVLKLAVKLTQQQLVSMKDRRLDRADREFLLEAIKALSAARKSKPAQPKEGAPPPGPSNPLEILG